ncbi:hypothetical protein ASD39_04140 [Sphingomonas sp. Root50]|nr:hypothetical protein ASD17_07620 [Sphingomonas sp. Root1294]KQY68600.1 hypothetical protein ASD39_04140 [Sphingomonas sp. Root50]KRB88006.1 hypothetical protein ASE22_21315 [Sphingomonas sp. Root720]
MKSGNTWMRLMLMHLLKPKDGGWTPDRAIDVGTGPLPRVNIESASLLDTSLLTADEQDLLRPRLCDAEARAETERCFFKSHDAYRFNRDGVPIHGESAGQAALYLVRDPRDIALSLAPFWGWSLDRTVAFINDPDADLQGIPKHFSQQIFQKTLDWSSHISSWLDQTRVPILVIRYEDLRASPVRWLTRAVEFLGLRVAAADIARAVELTDFDRLRREEETHGFSERFRVGTTFFRRAEPGEGRTLLDRPLRQAIERAHGAMMERLDYTCEDGVAVSP